MKILLETKTGKKIKIFFGFHDPEVGEALYIFLKEKLGQLSESEKEQIIKNGVVWEWLLDTFAATSFAKATECAKPS